MTDNESKWKLMLWEPESGHTIFEAGIAREHGVRITHRPDGTFTIDVVNPDRLLTEYMDRVDAKSDALDAQLDRGEL